MSAPDDAVLQRLNDLEIKLTFIDETVHALAVADADQSLRIAALEQLLRDLRSELTSLRSGDGSPHDEPPPPHY